MTYFLGEQGNRRKLRNYIVALSYRPSSLFLSFLMIIDGNLKS